jgi:hypothetical protein
MKQGRELHGDEMVTETERSRIDPRNPRGRRNDFPFIPSLHEIAVPDACGNCVITGQYVDSVVILPKLKDDDPEQPRRLA